MRTLSIVLFAVAALVSTVSCGGVSQTRGVQLAPPRLPTGLEAGVARADITPPPGLGLFGHGPEGRVAVGVRTRLYCRPFVFADQTDVIALVPCDLAAISMELQRAVATKLVAHSVPLGGDRLFLMATHTHAGPAHYFGSRSYSGSFASREYGFDPTVLEWLAQRIADGVESAYRHRRPACAAWGFRSVVGLSRNRSYVPFASNTSFPASLDPTARGDVPRDATPAQLAVDSQLSVLRVDARDHDVCSDPIGAFAVFGMHPTAAPNSVDLYHGDVFGFAVRHAEALIEDKGEALYPARTNSFVVGLANGIEGDVSPDWDHQSFEEARRIGERLGQQISIAFNDIATTTNANDGGLSHAYRDLALPNAQATHDPVERLCPTPELGVSAGGGAEDGPTRFRAFREFNEGVRLIKRRPCHDRRLPLVGPAGSPKADGLDLPAIAPLSVVRVAGEILALAPMELTTVVGLRIRERLAISANASCHSPVIGLTNAYLQYVTTAEEYQEQHYEGASNIYGPFSAAFVENQFACLAKALDDKRSRACLGQTSPINTLSEVAYDPERASVAHITNGGLQPDESIALHDLAPEEVDAEGQRGFRVTWQGTPPEALAQRARLTIEIVDDKHNVVDDDRGASVEVRYQRGTPLSPTQWQATWIPRIMHRSRCPIDEATSRRVRFEIGGPVQRVSRYFDVSCRVAAERKLAE